jgi:hypothetical protein
VMYRRRTGPELLQRAEWPGILKWMIMGHRVAEGRPEASEWAARSREVYLEAEDRPRLSDCIAGRHANLGVDAELLVLGGLSRDGKRQLASNSSKLGAGGLHPRRPAQLNGVQGPAQPTRLDDDPSSETKMTAIRPLPPADNFMQTRFSI